VKNFVSCLVVLCFVLFCVVPCEAAGRWRSSGGHSALVARSGIVPHSVGSHEGVGVSSVSFLDARNRACYWGKRTPVSVQYSQRGGLFYAVVRYN